MPASETASTDTASTAADRQDPPRLPRRSRNAGPGIHSIGGKLLIAFGLIAALTIGATFLSLMRFGQIESVLYGLVDVSMPALKLSMDVQSRASDVIETAGEVGGAQDEIERFNGMAAATERIGILWQAIEKLRAVVAGRADDAADPGAGRPHQFPGRRSQPDRGRRNFGEPGAGEDISAARRHSRAANDLFLSIGSNTAQATAPAAATP